MLDNFLEFMFTACIQELRQKYFLQNSLPQKKKKAFWHTCSCHDYSQPKCTWPKNGEAGSQLCKNDFVAP